MRAVTIQTQSDSKCQDAYNDRPRQTPKLPATPQDSFLTPSQPPKRYPNDNRLMSDAITNTQRTTITSYLQNNRFMGGSRLYDMAKSNSDKETLAALAQIKHVG